MQTNMIKIFLSYAREDRKRVEKIYEKLLQHNFSPWMDIKNILPGELWQNSIEAAIKNSDFFILCISNKSTKRGMIQKEIQIAFDIWSEMFESDIYLIPVRLEECKIPEKVSKFQYIDLFDINGDGFNKIIETINEGIKRRNIENESNSSADIKKVVSKISHDVRTYFALISGEVQWIKYLKENNKLTEKEFFDSIEKIDSLIDRADEFTAYLIKNSE